VVYQEVVSPTLDCVALLQAAQGLAGGGRKQQQLRRAERLSYGGFGQDVFATEDTKRAGFRVEEVTQVSGERLQDLFFFSIRKSSYPGGTAGVVHWYIRSKLGRHPRLFCTVVGRNSNAEHREIPERQ